MTTDQTSCRKPFSRSLSARYNWFPPSQETTSCILTSRCDQVCVCVCAADTSGLCGVHPEGGGRRRRHDQLHHRWLICELGSVTRLRLLCVAVSSPVTCSLQSDAGFFRIDLPNSGKVVLNRPLDYESRTQLQLLIWAQVGHLTPEPQVSWSRHQTP